MTLAVHTDGRIARAQKLRAARREEILLAAQQVIAKQGYQSTTVADVIESAKVSRGTFYLYFNSYEDLMHKLIDQFVLKLISSVRAVRIEDGSPMKQLYENFHSVISLLFEHRDLTRILLREAIAVDRVIDQKLQHLYSFLQRMIQGALRNGAKFGFIREADENIVAMAILGSIKEVVLQHLSPGEELTKSRETITKEILNFWMQGLSPQKLFDK